MGIRRQDKLWPCLPDDSRHFQPVLVVVFQFRIAPVEGRQDIGAQHFRGRLNFSGPYLRSTARAHFAVRQNHQTATVTAFCQVNQYPTGSDFDIVRVSAN